MSCLEHAGLRTIVRVEEKSHRVEENFPDTIEIKFKSNEDLPSGIGAQSVIGLAVKLAECSGLNSLPTNLTRERIKTLFGDENESCRIEYYYLQLETSEKVQKTG